MSSLKRADKLQQIWQPMDIGPTKVKNRVMMTAMGVFYGKDNILSDRHIDYYAERAKGGLALIITEQQAGHRLSKGSFYDGCTAWEKRAVPQYAKLADAVHEHGAKQFVQLFAAGVHDKGNMIFDDWHPLWGVSDIPSIFHKEMPHVVDLDDIKDLKKGFAQSASNVKVAGLDGIELHAAHSYMLGQFLSPAYNNRMDAYGGTNTKRCQFIIETAEEVRSAVGSDFTVGIRISFEEFMGSAGTTAEQGEEQVDILARTGLFDFINISAGAYHTFGNAVPPMGMPAGQNLPFGKIAKRVVGNKAKVFIVGGITDLYQAEQVLRDGAADMVALTRAHFADPMLVKKTQEGRTDEIKRCIGANECISRIFDQRPAACVVNPATGREKKWGVGTLSKAGSENQKNIIVIGGGISGMHFSAVAAERGHRVTIFEQNEKLGGHINILADLPDKDNWRKFVDDLQRKVLQHGVTLETNHKIGVSDINSRNPDCVVIATGSKWRKDGVSPYRPGIKTLPGSNQHNVFGLDDAIMKAQRDINSLGNKVAIIEETGTYLPLGLADILSKTGSIQVHLITPEPRVGGEAYKTLELMQIMPRLVQNGVLFHTETNVAGIHGDAVNTNFLWGGSESTIENVTSFVFALYRSAEDSLFYALKGMVPELHLLGDAMAPRRPSQIMFDAEVLGRQV